MLFHDHDHGLQPIANQVPWYYISLAILVGAALLEHGCSMVFRGWEQELKLPPWFSIIGDVLGIVLAAGMGCVAGHLVWNWALGGMVAVVGAFSSRVVLGMVRAKLGAAKQSLKDIATDSDPKQ